MGHYQVWLFGKISVITAQSRESVDLPGKGLELFVFLLLNEPKLYHRDVLATQLWPDVTAVTAAKYFRQLLWQLQSEMDVTPDLPLLLHQGRWLCLNPDMQIWSDAGQMADTFAAVRDQFGGDLTPAQFQDVCRVVAHYRGDLLSNWYQTWCLVMRERYRSIYLALVDKLMNYCLANGRFDEGIQFGLTLLHHDITREKTYRGLMRLYYLSGDRSSALRQYEQCQRILQQELQVDPTDSTRQLLQQILQDDLPAQRAVSAKPVAPATDANLMDELNQIKTFLQAIKEELDEIKLRQQPSYPT